MELKVTQKSTIVRVPIEDVDGNLLHTLKIDTSDTTTVERFSNIIDSLNAILEDMEKAQKAFDEKSYSSETQAMIARARMNNEYTDRIIQEIDNLFGENTVYNVFRENYEHNPYYVPDQAVLAQFIEDVIPIMSQVFEMRFKEVRKKYGTHRKGGH